MEFLSLLQSIRTPWLDAVMNAVTLLGAEGVFLVVALYIYWCTEKRYGCYLLSVGFFGILFSQLLKIVCRVPRPWVRDPSLTVVDGAMEGADGYSFPSGHAQNITSTLGAVAVLAKRRWVWILCAVLTALTCFSRMYLGVHTPMDVGFSIVTSILFILLLHPLVKQLDAHPERMLWLLALMLALTAAYLVYVSAYPFPADVDEANLFLARKSGWSLLGCVAAMLLSVWIDLRWLHFPTHAVWWAQILKTAGGLALVLAVKEGLKPVLSLLCGDALYTHAIRYFCCVLTAALLWPMTFRAFARLGRK